jgi:hypothetical protein
MWVEIVIEVVMEIFELTIRPIIEWFTKSLIPWLIVIVSVLCYMGYQNF